MLYFLLFVFILQTEWTKTESGPINQVTADFKEL